jgi:transcriptional regulator with XRE-family HTH domain
MCDEGLTQSALGRRTGLGSFWINRFFNHQQANPTIESLERVCEVLGVKLEYKIS